MNVRIATQKEIDFIKSQASRVQVEASMGYMNKHMPTLDMQLFYNSYYLVLTDQGLLKGWVLVGDGENPYTFERAGIILELYVFPLYRKNGYGSLLMHAALSELKQKGYRKVHLNVFRGNPARALYEKLGFKDVSSLMEKLL